MTTTHRIFKNTSWAILAKLTYRVSNALIAIFISRMIGVTANGIYNIALSYFTIGLSFAVWGFDQFMIREVSRDRSQIQKYYSNLIIIQALFGLAIVILIILISFFTNYPPQVNQLVRIFSISIFSESIIVLSQAVFMSFEKVKGISIVNTLMSTIKIISVFVIIKLGFGLTQIAWIFTAISLLSLAIYLFLTKDYLPKQGFKIDWEFGKQAILNSFIIFLISVLFTINSKIDVLTLSFISNDYNIGLYSAAISITVFTFLFPQAFRDVIYPFLSRSHYSNKQSTNKLYFFSTKYLLILLVPIAISISFFSPEIIRIIYGSSFAPSSNLLRISIWLMPLYSLLNFNISLLVIDYQGKFVSKILLASIVLTSVLNLIFYPLVGITASAIIRVFIYLFTTIVIVLKIQTKLYRIKYNKFIFNIIISGIFLGISILTIKRYSTVLAALISIVVYLISLILLQTFNKNELLFFEPFITSIRSHKNNRDLGLMKKKRKLSFIEFIHLGDQHSFIQDSKIKKIFFSIFGTPRINPKIRSGHILNQFFKYDLSSDARILDAGFGQGISLFYLSKKFQNYEIHGYEISPTLVNDAKTIQGFLELSNLIIENRKLEEIIDSNKFDIIYSADVLEHIEQDVLVLQNFYSALKTKGNLILHLPLRYENCNRIFKWFKKYDTPDHVRDEYIPEEIIAKLNETGFSEINIQYTYSILNGELAFELNNFIHNKRSSYILSQIITLPIVLPLAYLDIYKPHPRGNSMIITAKKE